MPAAPKIQGYSLEKERRANHKANNLTIVKNGKC